MSEQKRQTCVTSALWIPIILLVVLLMGVMFLGSVETVLGMLLGLKEKPEILRFLAIGIGGLLVMRQVMSANTRAQAMVDSAKAAGGGQREHRAGAAARASKNRH